MKKDTGIFPHYARYEKRLPSHPEIKFKKRILLISDTHISNDSIFNENIFMQMINEIKGLKNIDYILHLGDLTDDGTLLNYEYAMRMIKEIHGPNFYIIPGNHDSRNVGHLVFEDIFGSRTFTIEDEHLFIVGLDSSIPDQDAGRIGKRGMEKIRDLFNRKAGKVKILCFHHQLIPIPLTGLERSAIIDGGDALEMLLASEVDLVLNGHRHISHVYSCTDGNREVVIFNCGTASCNKTRYRELFTYTLLEVCNDSVVFNTHLIKSNEELKRGRYINRTFNINTGRTENELKLKIIHIANTHFSSDKNFLSDVYDEAVRQINSLHADVVIHSGDVTYSNKLDEFQLASRKLKEITHPMLIVPGTNDLQNIGWEIFKKMIGPLDSLFENDKIRVTGINSIDTAIDYGTIGRKKMNETIRLFNQQTQDKINIVTFYHNIIPHPNTKFKSMLGDSGNILKAFTSTVNRIHFILTGHDHISFSLQVEDTILSSCGTLSSDEYLDLSGNTYNIINCYEDGYVEIERICVQTFDAEIIGQYWVNL
ncbi:MAG: metallophosphoesterase [Spirochaetales bacterium]|nr:metallophosphoesterase [Spirochaetales bacterium]